MNNTSTGIFDDLSTLADPTRGRLLYALETRELTVSELAGALQLPQSTVSRHLKVLGDGGWVAARAEGTSRLYRMEREELAPPARKLWDAIRESLGQQSIARHDAVRLRAVMARRRKASEEFFTSAAGRWDALRAELFGKRTELVALPGLIDDSLVVGDLGCGTGAVSEVLAPFVDRVIGVDGSRAMLAAARKRLADRGNVELRHGELEELPVADGELGAALLVLALHHAPEPSAVLAEAARAIAPGGRLVMVDMLPHDREAYRKEMGHVWLGFSEKQLGAWLDAAGFTGMRFITLPADPEAKGPALFAATARRVVVAGSSGTGSVNGALEQQQGHGGSGGRSQAARTGR
ncbi:MAG TPA: metalloregulator ArsR/SmtB family transcription factor [Gemmatimonadaceae bacterium]|nr:metalloregulator ArsR/SmtB family transcription factor [Gemmatimonadaceae bacterium]